MSISELKQQVWKRDNFCCVYCGRNMLKDYIQWKNGNLERYKVGLTVDHIVPQSKGGAWALDNLVTSCQPCNIAKASDLPPKLQAKIDLLVKWWKPKKYATRKSI